LLMISEADALESQNHKPDPVFDLFAEMSA
jgi:hypothetical protein